jgi:O-antigen/teichoic acid export membrane protein
MTFLSDFIIHLLYGEAYTQAVNVLIIHIWTGVFVFLGVASGKWFTAENLQMLAFWRTFYGMVFNVIFNLFMIPKYGIQGAAIATLLSYFIAGLLFDFFNNTTKPVFFMKLNTMNPRRLFDN